MTTEKMELNIILRRTMEELKNMEKEILLSAIKFDEIEFNNKNEIGIDEQIENSNIINYGEKLYFMGIAHSIIENEWETDAIQDLFKSTPKNESVIEKLIAAIPNAIEDSFSDLTKDTLFNL